MIKAHNITLTIYVYKYIAPIYIFWKFSPFPQCIVYLISTHTTKSHNKTSLIIQHPYPPITPPYLSFSPLPKFHINPIHSPFYTIPHLKQISNNPHIQPSLTYPHIKYNHTTPISTSFKPNTTAYNLI